MTEEQQNQAMGFICLMLGALTVLAPKENLVLHGLLSDVRDWLNQGVPTKPEQKPAPEEGEGNP